MLQEINLYQPVHANRLPLSAQSLLLMMCIMSSALLGIWGYGQVTVNRLQQQVNELQQLRQVQQQLSANAAVYVDKIDASALRQQVKQLSQRVQQRQQALLLLRQRAPTMQSGFAERLTALAHPHVAGVWLEGVVLNDTPGIQSLNGRSLNPQLVAGYLRALASEPALRGSRFTEVRILGPKYVDASVQGAASAASQVGVRFEVKAPLLTAPSAT